MALIQLDHDSQKIKACQPLYMIVPDPRKFDEVPLQDRKVLYLLHGLGENGSAWQRFTNIETLANNYGFIVVMPTFGRSFYIDLPNGQGYFSYLVDELPQYLEDLFGLLPPRERTFIAGNSMGGYGAFKAAFHYPEKFAAAASFSGMLSMQIVNLLPDDPRKDEFRTIFGDLNKLIGSKHDPLTWLTTTSKEGAKLPQLYVACGTQDDLLPLNQLFITTAKDLGIPIEYHIQEGQHDWAFWQDQIASFVKLFMLHNEKTK